MENQPFFFTHLFLGSINDWVDSLFSLMEYSKQSLITLGGLIVGNRESLLAVGLVFGVQLDQNSSLGHRLKTIGMSQLWSASGFSVSLLTTLFSWFLSKARYISLLQKTILLLLVTLFFWLIAGAGISLLRASLSVGLAILIKRYFGKQLTSFRSLLYVVLIILIFFPASHQLVSLKFSIAAVFGIICLHPFVYQRLVSLFFAGNDRKRSFFPTALVTLFSSFSLFFSISLGMLPLISFTWGEVSLTNLFITTLLSCFSKALFFLGLAWIVWCGLLFIMEFFVQLPSMISAFSLTLLLPVQYLLELSEHFSQIAQFTIIIPRFNNLAVVIWYCSLFLIYHLHQSQKKRKIYSIFSLKTLAKTWRF